MWLLKTLMLLALIVWIGGIIFFAFAEAPTLFQVLPTTRLAGDVVSVSLAKLHWMGLISGMVFLICSLAYHWQQHAQLRPFSAIHIFVVLMLALTAVSQFGVSPRIRAVHAQLEMVQQPGYDPYVPGSVPNLIALYSGQFNQLHQWSTRLESGVLFLGLGVVALSARRFGARH